MQLSEFEWSAILAVFGIIGTLGGLAIALITFFLKRTMSNVDDHGKNIQTIKETFATKDDLEKTRAELRAGDKTEAHDKDINEIKRTYVTKGELKEIKGELRDDYKKLVDDVADIKENSVRKDDFHRAIADLARSVDKVYELLIKEKGGYGNGKQG